MIRRLKYHEIDFEKYQKCLETSVQRKYSAEEKFLKATAKTDWDLLVYGDYEAVMPVPFIYKLGFKIVVNPKLTQQLGVFSTEDSVELNEKFLEFLQKNYRVWYYAFNEKNQFKAPLKMRKNFLLLPDSYETIRQKYSPKRKRKLRLNPGVIEFSEIKGSVPFEEAESFILKNIIGVNKPKEIEAFVSILKAFSDQKILDFYGFYFKGDLINLVAVYQEEYTSVLLGTYNVKELVKLNGASNLIDFAIMKNIEHRIFDFEGGDMPHLEEYFRGFRAEMKKYSVVKNTRLSLIFSIFKKK